MQPWNSTAGTDLGRVSTCVDLEPKAGETGSRLSSPNRSTSRRPYKCSKLQFSMLQVRGQVYASQRRRWEAYNCPRTCNMLNCNFEHL